MDPNVRVTIMEKAEIMRSGACSAGMDAINTYIPEGKTPEDLVRWSRAQVGGGPLREDLALSNARELNESVDDLERWGLPILRDEQGRIRYRGKWDISIHGEQLKPIMAEKALESGADVYNRVTATALIMHEGRCTGAMGFGVRDGKFYIFRAKATVVSTGGAGTLPTAPTAARRSGCAPTAWARATPSASVRAPSSPAWNSAGWPRAPRTSAARWTPSPWATARPSSTRTVSAS